MTISKPVNQFCVFLILLSSTISLILIGLHTVQNPETLKWEQWGFYDWLINYQAGFVRRGLIGELIHDFFYNQEILVVNYLVFLLASLYIFFSVHLVLSTQVSKSAALLYIFAPTGFFWAAISNEYYFRKEMFFYLCVFLLSALYRYWHQQKSKLLSLLIIGIIVFFSIIMPFIHETFIFFCTLIFSIIIFKVLSNYLEIKKNIKTIIIFSLINFSIFFLLTLFKGDNQVSQTIWSSLSPTSKIFVRENQIGGGIGAIGWSFKTILSYPINLILSGIGTYYIFPLIMVFFISGYIHASIQKKTLTKVYADANFIGNFSLVLISFLPLFILGYDWGRWIVGIFVIFSNMVFSDLLIEFDNQKLNSIKTYIAQNNQLLIFFVLLFICAFTRIPECGLAGSGSSLLKIILDIKHNN